MTRGEAIKELKCFIGQLTEGCQEAIKVLIPELKEESKGERIRKAIVTLIEDLQHYSTNYAGVDPTDMLAWLEKQKKQKPIKKENTLTDFEKVLNLFLFDFANSPIENCEPKEYIKKYSAEILKAAYKELNAELQQDIFEAIQEGRREGYEVAKAEQKSAEWSEEDEAHRKSIISTIEMCMKDNESAECVLGYYDSDIAWLKSLRPQPKKELSIEKAIKWLDDTFYFLDNSSGRGRDCEITTHDFDSLEEMYDSFRKAVIVDSEPHWKPSEGQKPEVKLTGWVARDENGEIYAYEDYPEKDSEMWIGSNSMLLDRKSFPNIKWEDEPMEVKVTITRKPS